MYISGASFFGGAITATSTFALTGAATFLSTLGVTGLSTLTGGFLSAASSTINNTLAVTGGATLGSTLNVSGLSQFAGLLSTASSTIGTGTQAGGLTINGGATTTGNAYFAGNVGIGTTSPLGTLSINAAAGQTPFIIGSSTKTTFVVNHLGNTTIGTTSPITDVLGASHAGVRVLNDGGTAAVMLQSYRDAGNHSKVWGFAARGTASNPQPVQSGDSLLELTGSAWDGTAFRTTAQIIFTQESNASSGIVPSYIDFRTTPTGSLSSVEVARISSAGYVGIGTTSPWGLLSVNANGLSSSSPQFVVGSSTRTNFIVDNAGNVGIGTTTPNTSLYVVAPSTQLVTRFESSRVGATDGSYIGLISNTNGAAKQEVQLASIGGQMLMFTGATQAGVTEKMRIDTAGNVGIGTTTPAGRLNVYTAGVSSTLTNASVFENGNAAGISSGQVILKSTSGGFASGLLFQSKETGTNTNILQASITAEGADNWASVANASSFLRFSTGTCQ